MNRKTFSWHFLRIFVKNNLIKWLNLNLTQTLYVFARGNVSKIKISFYTIEIDRWNIKVIEKNDNYITAD